jgi:GNAT superfamily N-acetyltransferase
MIRQAAAADIDTILALGMECHAEAATRIPVDPIAARRVIARCVQSPQYFVWVKEVGGEAIAVLIGYMDAVWYNPAVKQASDLLFYGQAGNPMAVGAGRLLLKRFKEWAIARGAKAFAMAVSFGGTKGRRTGKIYEKEGFEHVGGLYILQVEEL